MEEEKYISLSISEAKKGGFEVYPNPRVGCVIVKNGKIIAKGYHRFFGGPHAEVNAIKNSILPVKGSDLYVTMEPCSTYGKTPPCTDLIIKSGIKRVFIGDLDPNPLHNGKAIEILRKAGIKVKYGILREECARLNEIFYKNMKEKMPYITIKFAQSLNGKIADNNYNSRWISSKESRIYSHRLRAESDCVLVGINTILKDNPNLDIRHVKTNRKPYICVIDPKLKLSLESNIFHSKNKGIFIITEKKNKNVKKYKDKAVIIGVNKKNSFLNLEEALKELYRRGITHILVEGGGFTIGQFIYNSYFDRILTFISPLIIGQLNSINSVSWPDSFKTSNLGINLKMNKIQRIGRDLLIEYRREV